MAKQLEKKSITGITVHSDYIPALQSIMLYYIDQVYPKSEDVSATLNKFKRMLSGELEEKKLDLKWYEYHTWIIYSLLQTFAAYANDQGLYQESDVEMDTDLLGKLTKSILENDTATQTDLYKEFFADIQAKQDAAKKDK